MSLMIRVGDKTPNLSPREKDTYPFTVKFVKSKNAPRFTRDTTGKSNTRLMSHSEWKFHSGELGIYEMLHVTSDAALTPSYAGGWFIPITTELLAIADQNLKARQATSKKVPGFSVIALQETYDKTQAIAIWLVWWMEHALKNFKTPVIMFD